MSIRLNQTVATAILAGVVLMSAVAQPAQTVTTQKPRMIAMTDGEVDDQSSFVRFLMYTSDFDVAGIIPTNSKWQQNGHGRGWIDRDIDAYGQVHQNLLLHEQSYPTADYLRSKVAIGNEDPQYLNVAPPHRDTPGSDLIVAVLRDSDPRPVHISIWGGAATLAHALWKLKTSYPTDFARGAAKARIYSIDFQDGGGDWISKNVKESLIVLGLSWNGTWSYHPQPNNPYPDLMSSQWCQTNVKTNHGPLGALYSQSDISEGDTPSFLGLINTGLRSHESFAWGGWGGRFLGVSGNFWMDAPDSGSNTYALTRWCPATQNDFQARMDWCVKPLTGANHQPVAVVTGGIDRTATAGQTVVLDATGSTDPDGNQLSYRWWHYVETSTYRTRLTITNPTAAQASFVAPSQSGVKIHMVLEVTDNGSPNLRSYQRVVFAVSQNVGVSSERTVAGNPAKRGAGTRVVCTDGARGGAGVALTERTADGQRRFDLLARQRSAPARGVAEKLGR